MNATAEQAVTAAEAYEQKSNRERGERLRLAFDWIAERNAWELVANVDAWYSPAQLSVRTLDNMRRLAPGADASFKEDSLYRWYSLDLGDVVLKCMETKPQSETGGTVTL